ncbi:MAG: PQQ-binding-like beta-propeller repeat protein [Acidobacteria bacterium]|nr:PQQ-binding-like beta-propeller repeat protein [Acidobacteriota bacterium]
MTTRQDRPGMMDRRSFISTLAAAGAFWAALEGPRGAALPEAAALPAGARPGDWPMIGYDIRNSRFNPHETGIGPENVGDLKLKWTFDLAANFIQSTPVAVGDTVFFTSYDGHFYAVAASTGKLKWKIDAWDLKPGEPVPDLRPPAARGEMRGSAFFEAGRVYFGSGTGKVHCLDAQTGKEIWATSLDPEAGKNASHISASPIVLQGKVFIGLASGKAQIVCLDAGTGAVRWRFYTVPGVPTGGGSLWTAAAVDAEQGIVYNVTGNPKAFPSGPLLFTESILAHDMESGELLWFRQVRQRDPFDLDFNTHPLLFEATSPTHRGGLPRRCVGAGTKAGGFHVFDRTTGEPYWNAMVTNSGLALNGVAFAYNKIFLLSNSSAAHRKALSVTVALHPYTGEVLWWNPNSANSQNTIAVANRLLYQGTMDGTLQALQVETGEPLWTYKLPGPRQGGISVANGALYTSSGNQAKLPSLLHAFTIDGK